MAKKKQKAHNIVPDQLSDRQLVKREFEESRQLLLDLQRERPEQKLHQKTILTGMEFVEPMLSRRIRAATNYMPVLRKRYEKYTHITPADYAFYLSQPTISIGQMDAGGSLSTGAALWILDTLKAHHKMSELYRILPFLTDDDDVEMPAVEDVCHSYETIRRLVSVVQLRLACEIGWNPPDGGVSFALTYAAIVDLIPDEVKARAVQRLDDKIWERADIFLAAFDDILDKISQVEEKRKRIDAEVVETQKNLEQLIKGRKKSPAATSAPLFAAPLAAPSVPPLAFPLTSPSSGNPVRDVFGEKLLSLTVQADKIHNERVAYQTQEKDLCRFAPVSAGFSTSFLTEKLGEKTAKALLDFHVDDPYEACFAFLYLLTTDDDRAWLYPFTLAVMDTVCGQLPWATGEYEEEDDTIWHPDGLFSSPEPEEDRVLGDEWYVQRYTTPDRDSTFSERVSAAQMIYRITGSVLPRNMSRYDSTRKILRKVGMPKAQIDKSIAAMLILGEAKRQSRDWFGEMDFNTDDDFDDDFNDVDEEAAPQEDIEKLKAENKALKKEIDRLRETAHAASREAKENLRSVEQLRFEAEEYTQELAGLREIVFNQQNGEYEKEVPDTTISFPYETQHRIVVFGGHDSWRREIKQKLPEVRFIDRDALPNPDIIRNADVVWIQANSLAHKHYYKIIDIVRKYNKPVRYFSYASATKCAEQIVIEDRGE